MTGRGRSPRVGSKAPQAKGSTNSRAQLLPTRTRPGSRTAGLGSTTRNNSGSPSTRTRSLSSPARGSPSNKSRGATRGRPPVTIPGLQRPPAAAATAIAASPAKKREDKQSRSKGRRPKFQDNPPAPEIVEKMELKSEIANKDEDEDENEHEDEEDVCDNVANSANGHQEEDSEEEVDDDESAHVPVVNIT